MWKSCVLILQGWTSLAPWNIWCCVVVISTGLRRMWVINKTCWGFNLANQKYSFQILKLTQKERSELLFWKDRTFFSVLFSHQWPNNDGRDSARWICPCYLLISQDFCTLSAGLLSALNNTYRKEPYNSLNSLLLHREQIKRENENLGIFNRAVLFILVMFGVNELRVNNW